MPSSLPNHQVIGFYVADGHGETKLAPVTVSSAKKWTKTSAEIFIRNLQECIPNSIQRIVEGAIARSSPETQPLSNIITDALTTLHVELNRDLVSTCADLMDENGSTLVLGLVILTDDGQMGENIWFASIGDSSIMLVDADTGTPIRIWKREAGGADKEPSNCSFEGG